MRIATHGRDRPVGPRINAVSVGARIEKIERHAPPDRPLVRLRRRLRPEPGYRRLPLYLRVVLINAGVLAVATTVFVLTPATVSFPLAVGEAVVLALGVLLIVLADAFLLRITFQPLDRLVQAMRTIDLLQPGSRLGISGGVEVRQVIEGFNQMLDRLERERQASNRRAINTREGEQRRIGQELHDEIGQRLTGILLQLERTIGHLPPDARRELTEVQDLTRSTLDEVGRIAWQLRPGILDDLGLVAAVQALTDGFPAETRERIRLRIDRTVPQLDPETELAVYRIAQEALTNALRHSRAQHITLDLSGQSGSMRLLVADDGRGLRATDEEGPGLRGMRERALLIGAEFRIESATNAGVLVELDVHGPAGD
jgi:two-component system, NarL family, sensor histidine kinase UhpB